MSSFSPFFSHLTSRCPLPRCGGIPMTHLLDHLGPIIAKQAVRAALPLSCGVAA